jgi:hypothetical protein
VTAETVDGRAAETGDDFGRLTTRGIEKFREKVNFNPVREGDRLWVRRFYVDIKEKESRFAGKSAVSVRRRVYWNDRGELIAIWDADFVHTERDTAAKRREAFRPAAAQRVYTEDELLSVDEHYAAETVQGADPRYLEDIEPGEAFLPRYRGPLVTGDVIAWLQGCGRSEIYPYRLGYQQVVTDWMGDDAILVAVDDRISGFNVLGDLTHITGSVTALDTSGEWPEVVCTVECTNQLDERTASGSLRVRSPSRERGLPEFPEPPSDHGLLPGMAEPEEGPWVR